MKKLIIIGAIVAALTAGGVTAGVVVNQPENVAINAITGVFEDVLERDEVKPLVETLTGGSVAVDFGGIGMEDSDIEFPVTGSGKVYFDKDDGVMLDDINVKLSGVDLINGGAYLGKDTIYIKEDKILDGAYGIKMGNLADEFKDSIFAPDSNSEYALDTEIYDQLMDIFEKLDDEKYSKNMQKDAKKLGKLYLKEFWKIFTENAEFESESDDVRVGGEKVGARVITITVDDGAMVDICEQFLEFVTDDKELEAFIEAYYGDEMKETWDGVMKQLEDLLDTLKESKKEIKEQLPDEIVIELATKKLSSTLLSLTVSVEEGDDEEELFTLDLGKDGIKKSEKIALEICGEEKIEYRVKENSSKELDIELNIFDSIVCSFEIDKKGDEFEIELKYRDETITISGDYEKSKGVSTFKAKKYVEKWVYNDYYTDEEEVYTYEYTLDISLAIDTKDKMPDIESDITSVFDITDKDIESWMEKIWEIAEDLEDEF